MAILSEAVLPELLQQLLVMFSSETQTAVAHFLFIASYRSAIWIKGVFILWRLPKRKHSPETSKCTITEAKKNLIFQGKRLSVSSLDVRQEGINMRKIGHLGRKIHSGNEVHADSGNHISKWTNLTLTKKMSFSLWPCLTSVWASLSA